MKTLRCSDMGITTCDYKAQGDNDDEVIMKMMDHANEYHFQELEEMTATMPEEEIKQKMKSKIREE